MLIGFSAHLPEGCRERIRLVKRKKVCPPCQPCPAPLATAPQLPAAVRPVPRPQLRHGARRPTRARTAHRARRAAAGLNGLVQAEAAEVFFSTGGKPANSVHISEISQAHKSHNCAKVSCCKTKPETLRERESVHWDRFLATARAPRHEPKALPPGSGLHGGVWRDLQGRVTN